ncbi:TetR/AcrR family transcriptional regulator [Nocardia seriolae]|uniref:HTH-type transcriptional regulator TcmR n=1 Tax=Nocardia seriolae TaxID=37332 RepID=A0A0B8NCK7_9NOCA|nr:TetR/AcrR family transcriptional regulator [Nocardia seriolae]APB01170.1 HTH-type transcriptional regulator TcmR [Nocardia seriolae]MTJ61326.1 TetR family transcriptional regulator [Nocardia seriolae]MTJ71738.1 TetR family transcriptional regulator [Nocardia seriolae]MTJ90550.1 TetR family transcriptional regulator [Nocardia seriolae]MTK34510.1 TetR family transcriptional regulator [Nocardia seriolae]
MTPSPTGAPLGLRERKKLLTRQNISDTATRLFLERGYDSVTIAEIAEAAEVAKMTVTNYFPRKEDLVLDIHQAFISGPAATVRERDPGESALAALRRAYLAAIAGKDAVLAGFSGPDFAALLTGSPALVARLREFHEDRERLLADTLAEETATPTEDFTARVAAALLGGVHRILFEEVLRRTVEGESNEAIATALTELAAAAFDTLEPALGGYAVRVN